MILTEKLILSEKLSLYEAVSQEIQDKLKTASEQCLKELKRLMAAQKKDTTRANFDTVIDEIRRNVILSAALMNNSTADIEDKKRGLADFKELLAKLKNMPELSTIDNNIVVQINDIYNNINSLATSTPSENTFDTAGDEIERMMEITATLRTHTDGDTTVDDSAIDDCWSLMKMALALSEYVDTDLTDKTITSLINDIDTLTRDLRAISADKLADGKQLCRDFKNTWAYTLNDRFKELQASSMATTSTPKLSDLIDKDWEAEYAAAKGAQKSAVWKKFLNTVYGANAVKFTQISPWLEELCSKYGFDKKDNPILQFVEKMLIEDNVQISASAFDAITNALNNNWLSLSDFKPDELASKLNLIRCRALYGLKDSIILDLLGRQNALRSAPPHKIDLSRATEVNLVLAAAGIDKDSTDIEGSIRVAAAILFNTKSVTSDVTSLNWEIRSIGQIRSIVVPLFGKELADKAFDKNSGLGAVKALINKMIANAKTAKNRLENLYLWMYRLKVRFGESNPDAAQYFKPTEMVTLFDLTEKQLNAYKDYLKVEPELNTPTNKSGAAHNVDKLNIKLGQLDKLIPLMLNAFAVYHEAAVKEAKNAKK